MTKGKRFSYIVLAIVPLLAAIAIQFILSIPITGLSGAYAYSVSSMNDGGINGFFPLFEEFLSSMMFYDIFDLIYAVFKK